MVADSVKDVNCRRRWIVGLFSVFHYLLEDLFYQPPAAFPLTLKPQSHAPQRCHSLPSHCSWIASERRGPELRLRRCYKGFGYGGDNKPVLSICYISKNMSRMTWQIIQEKVGISWFWEERCSVESTFSNVTVVTSRMLTCWLQI